MAIGQTRIQGLLEAEDVINTASAMKSLGARVERTGTGEWTVLGVGVGGFAEPQTDLDFGNSGTGVRLSMGMLATCPINARFTGDPSLSRRPMGRVIGPLEKFGARFKATGDGQLPVLLHGARDAVPILYELPVPSAQVKSAVLLAGLNVPGRSTIIEPVATRDHTERMLRAFGAEITIEETREGRRISVTGGQELKAQDISVPADPSSAAFPIVAALITDGSEITIENVMLNPTRTGLIHTLREMGADLTVTNERHAGGEIAGDIVVRSSHLKGVQVPASRAPSMIDEYPVLAVAAAFAEGTTRMEGLEELRVKESDRLAAVVAGLAANGVAVQAGHNWLEVSGSNKVRGGGLVQTHLDHRIAMSFIIMGLAAQEPVAVDDAKTIATSFPVFRSLMAGFGANIQGQGETD